MPCKSHGGNVYTLCMQMIYNTSTVLHCWHFCQVDKVCLIKVNDYMPVQIRYPRWNLPDGIPVMIDVLKLLSSGRQVKNQGQFEWQNSSGEYTSNSLTVCINVLWFSSYQRTSKSKLIFLLFFTEGKSGKLKV